MNLSHRLLARNSFPIEKCPFPSSSTQPSHPSSSSPPSSSNLLFSNAHTLPSLTHRTSAQKAKHCMNLSEARLLAPFFACRVFVACSTDKSPGSWQVFGDIAVTSGSSLCHLLTLLPVSLGREWPLQEHLPAGLAGPQGFPSESKPWHLAPKSEHILHPQHP